MKVENIRYVFVGVLSLHSPVIQAPRAQMKYITYISPTSQRSLYFVLRSMAGLNFAYLLLLKYVFC
jgi:hypothetical protein